MKIKQRMTPKKGTKDGAGNNNNDKADKDEVVRGRKGGKCFEKGVIIKSMREKMLREEMKGWSVGFPTTLRLGKDNFVKFKKHEGSSQREPVYPNTARTA